MSHTPLTAQQPEGRSTSRWKRSSRWLLVALVLGSVVMVVAVLALRDDAGDEAGAGARQITFTAFTAPGVSSSQLLELEAGIVGDEAVGDPASGRLPDVAAFHAAGVEGMRIDDGRLVVTMLASSTRADQDRVRSLLRGSSIVQRVEEAASAPSR